MTDNSLRALGRGCPLVSNHSAHLSLVQLPPDCVLIGSYHSVADARSLKIQLKVYKRPQNIKCQSLCLYSITVTPMLRKNKSNKN